MSFASRARLLTGLLLIGLVGGLAFGLNAWGTQAPQPAKGDDAKPSPDEADVHKAMEAFVAAFNENDAKKLAATLTATAEFIDEDNARVEGTAAIQELFTKFFEANKGAKLQVTPAGARTVAPGVVIEDGESVVTVPDKQSQSSRNYTVVFAKVDGAWKLASVRDYPEEPVVVAPEERLQELAFLLGEWVDEGGDALVENRFRLSADKTHMIREFTVTQQGEDILRGMQWIGIDPLTGLIKGWSFDTDGGRSESTWTKNGAEWLVRTRGVTSDGDESGATLIIKALSKDRVELKVMHKVIGDTIEADSTAIMVRKAPAPKK